MKNMVFWGVTSPDSCANRRFGRSYRLHYQRGKNQGARNNFDSNQQLKQAVKDWSQSQSQSHFATDGRSVSMSWCRVPSGAHDQMFVNSLKFTVLSY
jgi:hypothetical protein